MPTEEEYEQTFTNESVYPVNLSPEHAAAKECLGQQNALRATAGTTIEDDAALVPSTPSEEEYGDPVLCLLEFQGKHPSDVAAASKEIRRQNITLLATVGTTAGDTQVSEIGDPSPDEQCQNDLSLFQHDIDQSSFDNAQSSSEDPDEEDQIPALLPREDDDSDDDCSDGESDDDEGDDVAVGDLSVSTCDVANASSSTLSNTEHFDPADCDLPDFRDKDPSEAAYMIKQLMDLEKKLLTNCSTAAGHNSGDDLFQVFVRTPYGNTTTLSVNQSTTVADLKRQLSGSTTITPSNGMRLCYGGKPLNDSLTLSEYGITRHSTLEMHDGGLLGGSWDEDKCPGKSAVYS